MSIAFTKSSQPNRQKNTPSCDGVCFLPFLNVGVRVNSSATFPIPCDLFRFLAGVAKLFNDILLRFAVEELSSDHDNAEHVKPLSVGVFPCGLALVYH